MQISQPPMVQIGKFQCLSHRAFPEFFKTHPTLIYRSIVQASTSLQTNRQCYPIALVESILKNWTWKIKIECYRHLRTRQTQIVTPWAPVRAKNRAILLHISCKSCVLGTVLFVNLLNIICLNEVLPQMHFMEDWQDVKLEL